MAKKRAEKYEWAERLLEPYRFAKTVKLTQRQLSDLVYRAYKNGAYSGALSVKRAAEQCHDFYGPRRSPNGSGR